MGIINHGYNPRLVLSSLPSVVERSCYSGLVEVLSASARCFPEEAAAFGLNEYIEALPGRIMVYDR